MYYYYYSHFDPQQILATTLFLWPDHSFIFRKYAHARGIFSCGSGLTKKTLHKIYCTHNKHLIIMFLSIPKKPLLLFTLILAIILKKSAFGVLASSPECVYYYKFDSDTYIFDLRPFNGTIFSAIIYDNLSFF